ncbi:MAG: UMP kinase [DPANN group archaeon]|nr:UMP kinase [DPANN group archaeon]
MKTIVISLGGSLIVPGRIDADYLKAFRRFALSLLRSGYRLIIVCGGGKLAGDYIAAGKALSRLSPQNQDLLGIYATRINAQLVLGMFPDHACPKVIEDPSKKVSTRKRIIVGSGWKPGFSSDQDAVLLAKQFKAGTILNLSNIPYVYDKDPKKHKHFKAFRELSWKTYISLIPKRWTPRLNSPFDPVASRTAQRARIQVVVMDGRDFSNVRAFLNNKPFRGTRIS